MPFVILNKSGRPRGNTQYHSRKSAQEAVKRAANSSGRPESSFIVKEVSNPPGTRKLWGVPD